MAICFCGICIPYEVIIITLAFFWKSIANFFYKLVGIKTPVEIAAEKDGSAAATADANITAARRSEDAVVPIECHTKADSKSIVKHIVANCRNVVVRFTSATCAPCKAMEPAFFTIVDRYNNKESEGLDIKFISVDIDSKEELMQMFVEDFSGLGVPLFVFTRDGKEVSRFKGHNSQELDVQISDLIGKSGIIEKCNDKNSPITDNDESFTTRSLSNDSTSECAT